MFVYMWVWRQLGSCISVVVCLSVAPLVWPSRRWSPSMESICLVNKERLPQSFMLIQMHTTGTELSLSQFYPENQILRFVGTSPNSTDACLLGLYPVCLSVCNLDHPCYIAIQDLKKSSYFRFVADSVSLTLSQRNISAMYLDINFFQNSLFLNRPWTPSCLGTLHTSITSPEYYIYCYMYQQLTFGGYLPVLYVLL